MSKLAETYIDDPNYFDPPPKEPTKTQGADGKKRPLWIPKHGEGSVRGYFLRPRGISTRVTRRGHFNMGSKTTHWCESCTDVSRWGDLCGLVQARSKALMAKDSGLTQRDAQKEFTASERYYYPFYAWKTFRSRDGDMKEFEVGTAGLELTYTAAYTQLKAASDKLGKRCRACGAANSMSRLGWACGTCSTPVVWEEEEQRARKSPVCTKCKARKPAREMVACSKCDKGARLTVYDTQVTIQKLADGKTVDIEFEVPPLTPSEAVLDCERFDLAALVPYSDPETMLHAFGMGGDAARQDEGEDRAASVSEDEVPF